MNEIGTQRWINQEGILYPFNGEIVIHATPGPGVWQATQSPNPTDPRIGLIKIADSFDFPYKLYKTGGEDTVSRILKVWDSDIYINSKKNLGVIFNGTKGTGKTVCAKVLCNKLDMPTIIVNESFGGKILDFIQSIQFECAILIDEAEKTFTGEDSQILLKLIDGVYNSTRKIYILTTNNLTVNENLLGRPGRIRYIKEFNNLPAESVNEFVDDNLIHKSLKEDVLKEIDLLEISTIDIIRSLIEEVNILGELPDDNLMNIPKAKHIFDVVKFYIKDPITNELKSNIIEAIREFNNSGKSLLELFNDRNSCEVDENGDPIENNICEYLSNTKRLVETCYVFKMTSDFSILWKDSNTSLGTLLSEIDANGFFTVRDKYDETEESLCLMLRKRDSASLYKGKLSLVY